MLKRYLAQHQGVSDVLFTGGDPMVMSAETLESYIDPLIGPDAPANLNTIRIGSKSLAWWPYRYINESDSKRVLDLFARVVASGRQLAFQAHFSHPREIEHPAAQEAIRLIRMTGAQIRSQAPLIRGVNDQADLWQRMWSQQARVGVIPYYMFVERDTGAKDYFSVPLARASEIFNHAYSRISGTARTVRGPSMSASPGKVCVLGTPTINGQRVFVLKFLQARQPEWCHQLFLAEYDPEARWLDDLKPAFGQAKFFYDDEYAAFKSNPTRGSSGQIYAPTSFPTAPQFWTDVEDDMPLRQAAMG